METETDFIFLGSKIAADGDCSHRIKRHLLLRIKTMTNLDSILKSRDSTLPKKVCTVKAIVFPVLMYDVRVGLYSRRLLWGLCGTPGALEEHWWKTPDLAREPFQVGRLYS